MAGYGAPKGNKFHETYGIVTWRNGVKRRRRKGRSVIDRRGAAGQNAMMLRDELIKDQGGAEELSTAKLALIEVISRDVYYLDEIDRRIKELMTKANKMSPPKAVKSPKAMWMLYGYRAPVVRSLSANLLALGLEKAPPKVKTLDEILSEDEQP